MSRDHQCLHLPNSARGFNAVCSVVGRCVPQVGARLRPSFVSALLCLPAFLGNIHLAHADPLTTINAVRAEGCAGEHSGGSAVELSDALSEVARELATSGGLDEAINRTGYPAASSVAVHVKGRIDDAAVRAIIDEGYCEAVIDPQFNEAGIHSSGDEIWIVLAARMELPKLADTEAIAARVLELVNAARGVPRQCGERVFDAAPPLVLSEALTEVALAHARDMAQHGVMDHRGSDGSQPSERVTRAGYRWRSVGENVAAGQPNADEVVAGWLDSPGHCANIMAPQFTEMGIAFALASGNPATYWAQEFAAPR